MAENDVLSHALFYLNNNLCVIPIKFRSKEPLVKWEEYQFRLPTEEEVKKWFSDPNKNIAIVCGKVSGNVIVFDFDDKEKFNEFLLEVAGNEELLEAVKNTWHVETGRGDQLIFRTTAEPKSKNFPNIKVNVLGDGRYVVVPPSVHPSGKRYTFKRDPKEVGIFVLSEKLHEELLRILEKLEKREAKLKEKTNRLTDEQKIKLVNLFLPYWTRGRRHTLALMIAGALYWHDYALEDAKDVVKQICEKANDEEIRDRLRAVEDTYKRALDHNIAYKYWLKEAGIVGQEYEELVVKLLEIIKGSFVLGGEKLTVRKNENTLIICDFKSKKIKEFKIKKDGLGFSDTIAIAVPESVTVIESENERIFKVTFRTSDDFVLTVEGDMTEIVNYLRRVGITTCKAKIEDALTLIIGKMLEMGWCEKIKGDQIKGLAIDNNSNQIITIDYSTDYTLEQLKEALLLLNEFVRLSSFNPQRIGKIAKVIKWFTVAGLGWCFKHVNRFLPHLYLYGESDTGKTATAKFLSNIWLETPMLSLGSIDTPFRLGLVLSQHTFPVVVNEMDFDALEPEVIELWKNAVDGKIVRSRYGKNVKAFAVFCFTSNTSIPSNRAIQKRLVIIHFDPKDAEVLVKQRDEFEKLHAQREKLEAIGKFVADFLKDKVEFLEIYEWEKLAEIVLTEAFKTAGLEVPEWLRMTDQEEEESTKQSRAERIRAIMFNELAKIVRDVNPDFSNEEDIKLFLKEANKRIAWLVFRERSNSIVLLTSVLDVLRSHGVKIPNLRDLSYYIPNSEYKSKVYVNGRVVSGVLIDPLDFIKWLGFETEEEEWDIESEEDSGLPPDASEGEWREQEKDIELDDMEKEIVEIANFVMDAIPNPNYQVHEFVRQVKAKMGDNLPLALEKIEKLLNDGVLQSHFNSALQMLRDELKASKEERESKEETKGKGEEEREEKGEEESESKGESEDEEEEIIDIYKMADEVKEYDSIEDLLKDLEPLINDYKVDPENW